MSAAASEQPATKALSSEVADALNGAGGVAQATSEPKEHGGEWGSPGADAQRAPATSPKLGRVVDSESDFDSDVIDRKGLSRFIRDRHSAIESCYEAQLKRVPSLKGKVVVRFTIAENGRVVDVAIEENTTQNEEVSACIVAKMRAWTTPFRPQDPVSISYPFVLAPIWDSLDAGTARDAG